VQSVAAFRHPDRWRLQTIAKRLPPLGNDTYKHAAGIDSNT
jgi:hypothetical protein